MYTLPYLFIVLIKVFDLKVVDPERCFNLPIQFKRVNLIRTELLSFLFSSHVL